MLAQRLEQARGPVGEQAGDGGDVGVGGADGYPEAGRDPGEGVVAAQVHQSDERPLVRRELAPRSPSRETMGIVTHSTEACGRSSAAG